ncbi:MAG: YXWGXW repeat-containing protein [Labilithrix sp.]|nr:YXWGXW repeat-containing protein [Labilithrix sp.]
MRCSVVVRAALVATAVFFACGAPKLPAPPYTTHPTSALVEIPYPPPPARVEAVPLRPNKGGAVWIDGEWTWQTRRWAWKPGRWVEPPANARFAPWTSVRDRVGTLYVAAGAWRDASGALVSEPEPLAVGGPAPAAVVTPEGDAVRQGPLAPLDAGASDDHDARDAAANEALEELEELDPSRSPQGDAILDAGSEP